MIIRRIVKDVDGNLEATLVMSPDQAAFLINMGLVTLVSAGTLQIKEMTEEEFEKEKQEQSNSGVTQAQSDFLEIVDPTTLPQA